MNKDSIQHIREKNKEIYAQIAQDFDLTRKQIWPGLFRLMDFVRPNDRVLDAGCGNGRLAQELMKKHVEYVGVDESKELIAIAKKHNPKGTFFVRDILDLKMEEGAFDAVYCVAVLHHIPGKRSRIRAISELGKCVKEGGVVVITCWDIFRKKYSVYLARFFVRKLFFLSRLDFFDVYLPWQKKYLRYYHAFRLNELKKLLKRSGLLVVEAYREEGEKERNIVIVAKKPYNNERKAPI